MYPAESFSADPFADPSWKVAFLLQLRQEETVLVDGKDGDRLCAGLARLGYRAVPLRDDADITTQDATIVALPGSRAKLATILRVSRSVRRSQVLIFFRNRWSAYGGFGAGARNLVSRKAYSSWNVRAAMRELGYAATTIWLPLPKLMQPEEFVCADELGEVASSLGRGASGISLRVHLHDGFGIYGCSDGGGLSSLTRRIEDELNHSGVAGTVRVSRFDLRDRGALVLFLVNRSTNDSYVCRVVHHSVANHLQRHWDRQLRVRECLPVAAKALIPEALAVAEIEGHRCWVESRCPGTIGWRLARELRDRLDARMVHFLSELASASGSRKRVADADLKREMRIWHEQVGNRLDEGELSTAVAELEREVVGGLLERETFVGWVHGDYGYGNVLASASSGDVSAIIDWETGVPDGFIGVDLFNFLLQRQRTNGARSLADALSTTIRDIASDRFGTGMMGLREYVAQYLPDRHFQLMVLGVTLCRWIRREHRYELSTPVDQQDLRDAVKIYLQALAELGGS